MAKAAQYFGTDGIRGRVGKDHINPEFMLKLGWAAGRVLSQGKPGKVLIGKDTRLSGYMLESALEAGFSAAGMDVHLLGPMPTPAIAYLTRTLHADAGIVISASHNRYEDNGVKFFGADGQKIADEIEQLIEQHLEHALVTEDKLGKAARINDAPGRYIEYCKSTVASDFSLKGLTIVLDCANGATYHIAPHVFRELGADVIDIAIDPDGVNINDGCGSTSPAILKKTVKLAKADLGIAFDGDGDRLVMVDHNGNIVDGDQLLYVIARYYKETGVLGGGVVGTVMSNLGLETALQKLQIPFERTAVGDRNVLEKLNELGWQLGGESSGHIICLQKATTGDGIISALQVLAGIKYLDKTLYEIKQGMEKYPQTMINVPLIKKGANPTASKKVKEAVRDVEKLLASRGRVLLRLSGTEPVVRVMVEGEDQKMVESMAAQLADAVRGTQ